ncbi:sulfatase-like hydrolase/transferase [candidate division KSB1 bacterium]|nr:sulfatase-like hydrolase/transferase [candidate division KSB1 bacterium]NIR72957.1 sulfatase-like hydrolase/transferase [candidate division KSB1 bacterium]NIS25174.1 sulfatase-like hydrolase/transferase [candidate division KSB1 bacterium]NIT72077.1 sulfatase-like hydrolase/transferase [candidate division KSB1 bacterium]NIU25877.1 sulfatase-like hydrolase/transferase [candidate division KSB1 bacterium]
MIPFFLILCGASCIIIGLAADLFGLGGDPGLGTKQIALALIGVVMAAPGLVHQFNLDWHKIFSGPSVSPALLLRMSIFFGLATGFLEVVTLVARKWLFGIIFNLNPHLFWMKPLANLILFLLVGMILIPIAWRWPKLISLRVTAVILIFLTSLAPLLAFPQLHNWAKVLLALGITVQVSRVIVSYPEGFANFLRRTVPWMAGLAAAVCLGFYAWNTVPEYRAVAKLPEARPNTPNVLLLVLDTVRAQNLSLYGYHRPTTPRLEQFARKGVCFERALSTSPWTLPAHATMFTGRFTHELFERWQTPADAETTMGSKYPTLAESLGDYGYVTGGFIANTGYCASAYGLDRGFSRYEDHVPSLELFIHSPVLLSKLIKQYRGMLGQQHVHERKSAEDVNRAFLDWQAQQHDRPFFGFINYFDAHDPYVAPEPFELKFGTRKPDNPYIRHDHNYTPQEVEELRDAYDSCVAYLDHEVGSLLDELENREVLENTVVIITSDHGEQFGEHGLMYHVNSLYRQLLHVPLLVSFPKKVPAGLRIQEPVSLHNLPQTIIDLIGGDDELRFPGVSLSRYWDRTKASTNGEIETLFAEVLIGGEEPDWFPDTWPADKGSMQSLVSAGYHYIKYGDGSEELFDFETDHEEKRDLADSERGTYKLKQMRLAVATLLKRSETASNSVGQTIGVTGDRSKNLRQRSRTTAERSKSHPRLRSIGSSSTLTKRLKIMKVSLPRTMWFNLIALSLIGWQ